MYLQKTWNIFFACMVAIECIHPGQHGTKPYKSYDATDDLTEQSSDVNQLSEDSLSIVESQEDVVLPAIDNIAQHFLLVDEIEEGRLKPNDYIKFSGKSLPARHILCFIDSDVSVGFLLEHGSDPRMPTTRISKISVFDSLRCFTHRNEKSIQLLAEKIKSLEILGERKQITN
jgi:hypothetical protein